MVTDKSNGVMENGSTETAYLPYPKGFATTAIHAGQEPEQWDSMAVIPPLVMSSTFKQYAPADFKKYEYGRSGNPTRDVLERCLAALDGAKYGLCFSSGLGATTVVMSLFESGDEIICGDDLYGGTYRLLSKVAARFGITTKYVDARDPKNVSDALTKNTKMIWVETPTNPTLKVNDIEAIGKIARENGVWLLVDNTFLTPYLQRPLEFGADIVLYSITKYMNGHSDVVMGSIATSNEELYEKLKFLQNSMGVVPSPFDCFQVNRGLKTLALRMRQHSYNGLKVAQYLEKHQHVEKVLHPGLPSHSQHELFKKQTSGHSGVVSFYIKNATLEQSKTFLSSLKVFTLAESLGGFESLAELPSVMTHASVPPEQRKVLNIGDNLVRLSVGLEDEEDLIEDLKQALEVAMKQKVVNGSS